MTYVASRTEYSGGVNRRICLRSSRHQSIYNYSEGYLGERNTRVLITGCSGFIGSRLVSHLLQKGHDTFCVSRSATCPNIGRSNHLKHDLVQEVDHNRFPPDLDCIVHLAAALDKTVQESEMFRTNTLGTLNLLEYGKRVGINEFVFASSGAVYGYSKTLLSEKSSINPTDFYGLSKYQSELLVNHYSHCFSTAILRLFFPYGPGQIRGIVPRLTHYIKSGIPITIYNEDNPRINPIYIADVVNAIVGSLSLGKNSTINIGGNEETTIRELSLMIGSYLKLEPIFRREVSKEVENLSCDNSLMRTSLGVVPAFSLEQGIRNYIECSDSSDR